MAKSQIKPEIEVEALHKKFKHFSQILKQYTLTKAELKKETKRLSKEEKAAEKEAEKEAEKDAQKDAQKESEKSMGTVSTGDTKSSGYKKKIFLIEFNGDIKASSAENLAIEVNSILGVATPQDEVVVRVESPGGVVHGYGLAASQLLRIREKNIPLTVCVDKVAASGGYLMSVPANKILAAPFAIIGSIGVVAQVPNFNRLLRKHDVDYKEYTAGEFKRTVSIMGEITEKGEEKFKEQLEATHKLFKNFVGKYRPQLKISEVATGEYWYGEEALLKGLIDEIKTSDEYLTSLAAGEKGDFIGKTALEIFKVKFEKKPTLSEKLSGFLGQIFSKVTDRALTEMQRKNLF